MKKLAMLIVSIIALGGVACDPGAVESDDAALGTVEQGLSLEGTTKEGLVQFEPVGKVPIGEEVAYETCQDVTYCRDHRNPDTTSVACENKCAMQGGPLCLYNGHNFGTQCVLANGTKGYYVTCHCI